MPSKTIRKPNPSGSYTVPEYRRGSHPLSLGDPKEFYVRKKDEGIYPLPISHLWSTEDLNLHPLPVS